MYVYKKESYLKSNQGNAKDFKEQARGISFWNVSCDRQRRDKTKKSAECRN